MLGRMNGSFLGMSKANEIHSGKKTSRDEMYRDNEAEARFHALLKAAVNTPPAPLKSMTPKGMPPQSRRSDRKALAGKKQARRQIASRDYCTRTGTVVNWNANCETLSTMT